MNKVLGIIQTKAKTSTDILLVESGKVGQNNQGDMKGIVLVQERMRREILTN